MQKKCRSFRWIEEAEVRRAHKAARLQRGAGEPPFVVVLAEPGFVWRGRIRAFFGNVAGCRPEPQRVARPVRHQPLLAALRNVFD